MTASTTRKGTTTSATKAPAPKPAPAKKVAPPAPPAGTVIIAKTREEYDQLKAAAVAKSTPAAAPAPAEDKPTWAAAKAMGKGKAHLFRKRTQEIALANGYKDVSQAPFSSVAIFEKGNVRFTVTYSEQDFVRKVEGPVTIIPGEADKWKKLNAALVAHA